MNIINIINIIIIYNSNRKRIAQFTMPAAAGVDCSVYYYYYYYHYYYYYYLL